MADAANIGGTGAEMAMVTDGPCLVATVANLEAGGSWGKAMRRAAIDKTRVQVEAVLGDVLASYGKEVAPGEVGATGSARATVDPPVAGDCPTGLLYGRVQSGKTLGMVTFTALAVDNGFRTVTVLTSDNVKLVGQTADRFGALEGPLIRHSTQIDRWMADASHVAKELPNHAVVIVCSKNEKNLAKLLAFLEAIGAANYPAIVLDDEADQATPDTTTNARAKGKPNAPKHGSTISRRTMKNDAADELGESVRQKLRHNVFIQVTATPYALLLQNTDSPSRPKFTKLLQPGDGYTGGEHFFSLEHVEEETPPLIFVAEDESDELERGTNVAPAGLVEAISFFLVGSAAQACKDPSVRGSAQNFLCHTSVKTTEHDKLSDLIRDFVESVGDELRKPEVGGEIAIHLQKAHTELTKTLSDAPTFDAVIAMLRTRLPNRDVIPVNSNASNAEFKKGLNFIVGGNILGRGLTIENLLVTYYLRHAKVSQMDTMLQHARMFGYRMDLMPYTRVFLPKKLATRFHRIHIAEQNLRALLSDPKRASRTPIQVGEGLRATRLSVLDMESVEVYPPGAHIYPGAPLVSNGARKLHERATKAILPVLGGSFKEYFEDELRRISIDQVLALLPLLPADEPRESNWDLKGIEGVLLSLKKEWNNEAFLYCRTMKRTTFTQGALGGPVLKELRGKHRPVLCLFKDVGKKYKNYDDEFWYPTLVLPEEEGMPAHVFNSSE